MKTWRAVLPARRASMPASVMLRQSEILNSLSEARHLLTESLTRLLPPGNISLMYWHEMSHGKGFKIARN